MGTPVSRAASEFGETRNLRTLGDAGDDPGLHGLRQVLASLFGILPDQCETVPMAKVSMPCPVVGLDPRDTKRTYFYIGIKKHTYKHRSTVQGRLQWILGHIL